MILRSLRVRNIRSYTSGEFTFKPGTTLLTGDVGSGKTSLLYAIEMALFGFAEVEPAYLVRHRTREAEVVLTLADQSHAYEFRRRFRRKLSHGKETFEIQENSFAIDGERTKYSATELRQRSIDLLGFPDNPNPRAHSDVWRWAVYIPQERMRDVLLQAPTERLETVRKALGLEQYQLAAENAQELSAELRRIAELYEAEAEQLKVWSDELPRWTTVRLTRSRELEELERAEAPKRSELAAAEEAHAQAESARLRADELHRESERLTRESSAKAEELRQKRARAQAHRSGVQTLRAGAEHAESSRQALAGRLGALATSEQRWRDIGMALEHSEKEERRNAQAQAERDAATHGLAEARDQSTALASERERVAEALRGAESERPTREPPAPTPRDSPTILEELTRARTALDEAHAHFAQAQHVAHDLEELMSAGSCPRCHQPVRPEEFRSHFLTAHEGEREAAEELRTRRERVGILEEERSARERYERARERVEQVEKRCADLRAHLVGLERREEELDGHQRRAESSLGALAAEIELLRPRLEERSRLATERAALEQTLREDRGAAEQSARLAEEASGNRARAELLEQEAAHLDAEVEAIARQRSSIEATRTELASAEAAAQGLIRSMTEARSRRDSARAELERLLALIAGSRAALDEADRRIGEADRGVRSRSERLASSVHARQLAGWLAREFRESLLDLEHRRLAQAQAEFNRAFARYFSTLVEDPSLAARCDVAFAPAVEIDGERTPAEALSGGERTALALAFRLAMGRVVRSVGRLQLETLILDEPTDGFSPEQVSRMGELLEELSIPQVLLVSHETQLAGVADEVIRIRKEGGKSELMREPIGVSVGGPSLPPRRASPANRAPALRSRPSRTRRIKTPIDQTPPDPTEEAPPRAGSR
jgi:DNA repair protein SbcC/Rad50